MMRPSLVPAELELGVGDDDAALAADLFAERIDRARHALRACRATSSPTISRIARDRDVLVVTGFGLGRRAEDRGLELCALERGPARVSRRPAFPAAAYSFQAEPEMIAADHAFDREYRGAPAQHRAPGKMSARWSFSAGTSLDDLVGIGADHVMRHHAFELPEPPGADLGQHRALHRDGLGHHDVEGADAVGGEQQHAVVADGVDIAHLAAPDAWQRQIAGEHRGHRSGFHQRSAVAQGASGREGETDSSLRQRNELMFLGNMGKAAGFPVLFRLLDPLLAGGDEIPPDMARAFQRVAAEEHHARRL